MTSKKIARQIDLTGAVISFSVYCGVPWHTEQATDQPLHIGIQVTNVDSHAASAQPADKNF